MCSAVGGCIVCKDKLAAKYTYKMACDMNLKISYPITFDEFLSKSYHAKGVKRFYIDNADQLLQKIAKNVRVEAIVMDDTTKWDNM